MMTSLERTNVFILIFITCITFRIGTSMTLEKDEQAIIETLPINRPTWSVEFETNLLNMTMTQKRIVQFRIKNIDEVWGENLSINIYPIDDTVIHIDDIMFVRILTKDNSQLMGNFTIEALFMGNSKVFVELQNDNLESERSEESLNVIVLRKEGLLDLIFMIVVGTFVMLIYINFGAALDLDVLKSILLKPIGPAIGLMGQFCIMPILGYLVGYILFRDMIELRLGLFFTGSAPGGGTSNIFTVILNGNINLSITMTAISNLAAFIMMPFWIFTLGGLIFRDGNIPIPYEKIAMMSFSLVLPLCFGIALQKFFPVFAKKLAKLLKPISLILIIVITIFAYTVNSYMFKLFSWKIIIASSALPWLGYFVGWILATLLGQSAKDSLTIAIETGIQNTGIAIFMLLVTLPQPQADMTSAIPVASSMMTPIPLLGMYLIKKCFCRTSIEETEEAPNKEAKAIEVEQIVVKGVRNTMGTME